MTSLAREVFTSDFWMSGNAMLKYGFNIPHSAQFELNFEKQQLLIIVDATWHAISAADWRPHPMFGKLTVAE
jgi:hypothetical protein